MLNLLRQQDMLSGAVLETNFICVGAGGIGSFAIPSLCKMGFKNIMVYDKDDIESHNIPNQNYSVNEEGLVKVEALKKRIEHDCLERIKVVNNFFWGLDSTIQEHQDVDIIITGVDSMDARKKIWDGIKSSSIWSNGNRGTNRNGYRDDKPIYLVDARMSSRASSVWVLSNLDKKSVANYESSLYDDSLGEQEKCTAKSIIHTANFIAYLIGNIAHGIVKNEKVHLEYHANLKDYEFGKSKQLLQLL